MLQGLDVSAHPPNIRGHLSPLYLQQAKCKHHRMVYTTKTIGSLQCKLLHHTQVLLMARNEIAETNVAKLASEIASGEGIEMT